MLVFLCWSLEQSSASLLLLCICLLWCPGFYLMNPVMLETGWICPKLIHKLYIVKTIITALSLATMFFRNFGTIFVVNL
ncbi:hypothetical protein BRADI_1g01715v3 [Brachypodium distachyon]|uniref:Uncharacterized protein n=1 Tax=Brachypodium distachyon TaxID=15368 RepID=A0A0Q3GNV7_BRADI|nr:hypothetical protein BRADI_1g01715v3 [Brachypodium distachyon]